MGNPKMGHCHTEVNLTSPRVLEATIVEIRKQPSGTKVIQSQCFPHGNGANSI
jgi:hypothetical protein